MKSKISKILVVLLTIGIVGNLCGCGMKANQKNTDITENNNGKISSEENKGNEILDNNDKEVTGNELIKSANLTGSVIETTENGCTLSQTMLEGEELAYESAEGNDSENKVDVMYEEDTVFQSAIFDTNSGNVLKLEDINRQDIKKQSRLLLYGNFQDTYTFQATKVIVYYMQ